MHFFFGFLIHLDLCYFTTLIGVLLIGVSLNYYFYYFVILQTHILLFWFLTLRLLKYNWFQTRVKIASFEKCQWNQIFNICLFLAKNFWKNILLGKYLKIRKFQKKKNWNFKSLPNFKFINIFRKRILKFSANFRQLFLKFSSNSGKILRIWNLVI